ncbi:MAG: hypothetical protein ACRD96_21810, partial [Bryobacteraceae bacterium]
MLRAVIICPDPELGDKLQSALLASHRLGVMRRLETYPNELELKRILRASAPQVVFLSIASRTEALDVARKIDAT